MAFWYMFILFVSSSSRTVDCRFMQCIVCVYGYVSVLVYWLSVPLWWKQIVFLNWYYWLLISWHFLSPKRTFYFNVDEEVSASGGQTAPEPRWGPPSVSKTSCCVPNRRDRSTSCGCVRCCCCVRHICSGTTSYMRLRYERSVNRCLIAAVTEHHESS